ncbi:hypothetical protein DFH09DRAFT_1082535 [Mycena vulgaris]|nr:hypothetical protein DFH09DRAFT_1082535 [Mycena vulgaris]
MRQGIPVDLFTALFETCTNQLDSLALVYGTFPSALPTYRASILADAAASASAFPIDLSEFPVLTSLEIDQANAGLISSLKPDNREERLVLLAEFYGFLMGEHPSSSWAATYALVANSPMPALRQLELRIHLETKGLLIVAEHREEWSECGIRFAPASPSRTPRKPTAILLA